MTVSLVGDLTDTKPVAMKANLLIIIGLYIIISSEERLITRNLKITTDITTKLTPPLRIARDISEDDSLIGFSKENTGQSDELIQPSNKKTKFIFKFRSVNKTQNNYNNISRIPRESSVNVTSLKNGTLGYRSGNYQKFVKKPIPKYSELEYDDDFQDKVNKSPIRVADSGEHEDEDFNLGDYEFDINHDEFVGRGKPLDPINKVKEANELITQHKSDLLVTSYAKASDVKLPRSIHVAALDKTISKKKERAIAIEKTNNKLINNIKQIDYYYDDTTVKDITKETSQPADSEDEPNEENENSKEFDRKIWFVRTARSLWNMSNVKTTEKTSRASKVLTILPLFPQVPYDAQFISNVKNPIKFKFI